MILKKFNFHNWLNEKNEVCVGYGIKVDKLHYFDFETDESDPICLAGVVNKQVMTWRMSGRTSLNLPDQLQDYDLKFCQEQLNIVAE